MAYYNGRLLSADVSVTEGGLRNSFSGIESDLQDIVSNAAAKYAELVSFASEEPSVSVNEISTNYEAAIAEVKTAIETAIKTICSIISAIEDFSDGTWDNPNNKQFLDNFIRENAKDSIRPGGDDGAPETTPPETTSPVILTEELPTDTGINPDTSSDPNVNITNEENLVESIGVNPESFGEAIVPSIGLTGTGEVLESVSSDLSSSVMGAVGSLGSDLFALNSYNDGTFSIPTQASAGENFSVKSSSVIGTAGIVAAAAAALGGKFFYDSKYGTSKEEKDDDNDNEDSETTENESENENINEDRGNSFETVPSIINMNEKTGSDVNYATELSIVDFKKQLFEDGVSE